MVAPAGAKKIVIRDPPLVHACPHAPSWDEIDRCLHHQGNVAVVRSLPDARLVHLDQKEEGTWVDAGVLLYIARGKEWRLAGYHEGGGGRYDVLGLAAVTISKRAGYRIDLGQLDNVTVQPDGVTNVPAVMAIRQSMYCKGDYWRCVYVTTACDVLVRGAVQWPFRGAMTVVGDEVHVDGDRSRLSPMCMVPDVVDLGWAQPPD
jgi:hypothetical protein